jgi:hypothetical protein
VFNMSIVKLPSIKFFQFNQKTGKCEENYDENKIRMIKIVNLTADI